MYDGYYYEYPQRDLGYAQKRILITVADYDEEAGSWIYTPIYFIFFTGHFTNKLQGDNWEEFWMTFEQVFLIAVIDAIILGLGYFVGFKMGIWTWSGAIAVGAFIGGFLLGGVLMGLISVTLMNFIFTGNSIYTAALWGAKWDSFGWFFGIGGAHAFMYNQQLAKEVTL